MKNIKNQAIRFHNAVTTKALQVRQKLSENTGEGYVDTAVVILISVVLGALLLAGLYSLFGDVVLPTLVKRVKEMFDYAG